MSDREQAARIDSLIQTNKEILQWLKVLAGERVSDTVKHTLGESRENYELYQQLDGETPVTEVIDEVSMAERTVYTRLKDWQRVGIISKEDRGEYERIASLDSLGIEEPQEE